MYPGHLDVTFSVWDKAMMVFIGSVVVAFLAGIIWIATLKVPESALTPVTR